MARNQVVERGTERLGAVMLALLALPRCGDTTSESQTGPRGGTPGVIVDGTGGTGEPGGTLTGGAPTGGRATGGRATGGRATGGRATVTGGMGATGYTGPTGPTGTGGTPPNGASCICALADRLEPPAVAGCDSSNPSNCTLQKAYCGETCAADPTCGTSCIDTFRSHVFDDAATYTWGSCTVTIRCVAPNG